MTKIQNKMSNPQNDSDDRRGSSVELSDEQRQTLEEADARDPDKVSNDELEGQTWVLGEVKSGIKRERGMKWKLTEPDDDEVIADLIQSIVVNPSASETRKKWVQSYIESPEITDERWENDMVAMDRFMLFDMVFEFSEFDQDSDMQSELDRIREQQLDADADEAEATAE